MKIRPVPDEVETITKLAGALDENPRDQENLVLAAQKIADGKGDVIFKALLEARGGGDTDRKTAIVAMMPLLETMMDASAGVAGYLMARLYPIARRSYLHHICDRIELWMDNSASDELAESLMRLASEGVRPQLRKDYEAWAARIHESRDRSK